MKKKWISILLTLSMALGLTACGGGNAVCKVTVEGKEYDLSADFQDVVGEMVKNDIMVINMVTRAGYDEDGKFVRIDITDRGDIWCYAQERPTNARINENPIIFAQYEMGLGDIEFKTAQGIDDSSDAGDVKKLEGYVPQMGLYNKGDETYAAMYIDGKVVDLEQYEDIFDEWVEEVEESGFMEAKEKYLENVFYYPASSRILNNGMDIERIGDWLDDERYYAKEEMLIAFAAQEAGELLEAGKIDSYDIIFYEEMDGEMIVNYYHYYYDDNWDQNKFR